MRLLIFHVDSFTCTVTQKGRSPLIETPAAPSSHIDEGLLVLASAEAADEVDPPAVAKRAAEEVERLAEQLKAREIMVLPFAHLFAEPCPPAAALALLDAAAEELRARGYGVQRPPFGWFHSWDLKAKGHPLSRVARTVHSGPLAGPPRGMP
jgi:threonyl-tRNA synthetase